MTFKGFGERKESKNKKHNKNKQYKNPNFDESNFDNPIYLKERGLEYYNVHEYAFNQTVKNIRLENEKVYGQELIEARLLILAAYYYLANSKAQVPGRTDDTRGKRLTLITTFFHGQNITETAISEGNPVKASAALKQDIEILTRLYELREGKPLKNTPQLKNAPINFNEHYGDMNKIAHITQSHILDNIAGVSISDDIRAVSIMPLCNTEGAKELYNLHINICHCILLEAITLHQEMYDYEEAILVVVKKILNIAIELLTQAGWKFINIDDYKNVKS